MAEHMAIIRSMSTKEGDHGRATYLLRNGYLPQPPVRYPTLGSLVAKELGDPLAELPNFVSISPYRNLNPAAYSPGFLGSQFAPLFVGEARRNPNQDAKNDDYDLKVADLEPPAGLGVETVSARLGLLNSLNDRFIGGHAGAPAVGYKTAYDRAVRADAQQGGQGLRSGRRADRRSRRLRPQPLRPGLPAGPPAGRTGRAVRRSDAGRRQRPRLGHARRELRGGQGAEQDARSGLGHADERLEVARPARVDH